MRGTHAGGLRSPWLQRASGDRAQDFGSASRGSDPGAAGGRGPCGLRLCSAASGRWSSAFLGVRSCVAWRKSGSGKGASALAKTDSRTQGVRFPKRGAVAAAAARPGSPRPRPSRARASEVLRGRLGWRRRPLLRAAPLGPPTPRVAHSSLGVPRSGASETELGPGGGRARSERWSGGEGAHS